MELIRCNTIAADDGEEYDEVNLGTMIMPVTYILGDKIISFETLLKLQKDECVYVPGFELGLTDFEIWYTF
jgi:hypothetical protein